MKNKLLLSISLILIAFFVAAQQVPRNLVVLEMGTGTWCPYCPAASNGAQELLDNGYSVAVIKYHSGDSYANTYSNARVSYYNISGFPTTFFDGLNAVVGGGGANQSMFPQYSTRVNQRMAVPSAFTIEVEGTHSCFTDFNAEITVNKVATNNSTSLRLHAVITEKGIPENWQGMSEVTHTCRLMVPNQNGTSVSFGSGNLQQHSLQFSLDPGWVFENLELVVFLQDHTTREIFQGTKMMLTEFLPEHAFDMGVSAIGNIPEALCSGAFEPVVTIRNFGSDAITEVDIVYHVNNGPLHTYSWSGSLNYLESEVVALPAIDFAVAQNNELVVYTLNPNGNADECEINDLLSITVPEASVHSASVKLFLRTDINPQQTTWELLNEAGEAVYSGGPYTVAGQTHQVIFNLSADGCYTFHVYDSGGDGMIFPGVVMLMNASNQIFFQVRDYGLGASTEFSMSGLTGIEDFASVNHFSVFPNPVQNLANLHLDLVSGSEVEISLLNLAGQLVRQWNRKNYPAGSHQIQLDVQGLDQGIYLISAQIGTNQVFHKISVIR